VGLYGFQVTISRDALLAGTGTQLVLRRVSDDRAILALPLTSANLDRIRHGALPSGLSSELLADDELQRKVELLFDDFVIYVTVYP
jgi:hypothetical protein